MPHQGHRASGRERAHIALDVYTPDLLGHGRSDKPTDPAVYSMWAFGQQVVALLDHLGVQKAVVGGTSLGANTTLEVAAHAPHRVRGMPIEMPVLDNAVEAGIIAFAPLLFVARAAPIVVDAVRWAAQAVPRRFVPFWSSGDLDTFSQEPEPMAAAIHGIFYGRVAPPHHERITIEVPALVIGHPRDPIHPAADAAMLAEELVNCRFVRAVSVLEWRRRDNVVSRQASAIATPRRSTSPRARRPPSMSPQGAYTMQSVVEPCEVASIRSRSAPIAPFAAFTLCNIGHSGSMLRRGVV